MVMGQVRDEGGIPGRKIRPDAPRADSGRAERRGCPLPERAQSRVRTGHREGFQAENWRIGSCQVGVALIVHPARPEIEPCLWQGHRVEARGLSSLGLNFNICLLALVGREAHIAL